MNSIDRNLLGSFVAFFHQGLLVVGDSESRSTHEGWDPATEYVHFDRDSLYLAVQSAVDGAVSVTVFREPAPVSEVGGLVEAFTGAFESRYGKIKICSSDEAIALVTAGRRGITRISVFVDELNWPARVVVVIGFSTY